MAKRMRAAKALGASFCVGSAPLGPSFLFFAALENIPLQEGEAR